MSEPAPWIVVHEGIGPVSPGSKKMLEGLVKRANPSAPPLEYIGISASTVPQARKEMPSFQERLQENVPDRILTFGPLALMETRQDKTKPLMVDERGRMQWAGAMGEDLEETLLLPTINPAQVWVDPEMFRDFAYDAMKWASTNEPIEIEFPEYELPTTIEELKTALSMLSSHAIFSLDVETMGFDAHRDELLSIGIGTVAGPIIIVPQSLLQEEETKDLIWDAVWPDSLTTVAMQNGKFDLQFLATWWGAFPDTSGARLGDTMLLHYLMDERPVRSRYRAHGLKDQARVRYDVPDYHFDFESFHARYRGEEGTEPLTAEDWADMYQYHAMDCRLTAMLWQDLLREAREESPNLVRCHDELLIPATLSLAEAEFRGIPVNREYLIGEKARLERRQERRLRAIRAWLDDEEFLPSSPAQLVKVIRDRFGVTEKNWPGKTSGSKALARKTNTPTGEGEINQLVERWGVDDHRAHFLRSIEAFRHDAKKLSTYVDGILEGLGPDERVHPSFNIAGTVTGRLSASGPNMQAIPRAGTAVSVRRAFRAPPGWVLLEADYSQLELRTAAMLSGDPDLTKVYADGRDLHLEVAAMIFGRDTKDISEEERFMAKAINFGVLYGRSGWAISKGEEMTYAVDKLGMDRWSPEEGDVYIERWMEGFPVLRDWIENTKRVTLERRYSDTPFGRRRRYILTRSDKQTVSAMLRQAVNTPVQSVASDVCLNAFNKVSAEIDLDVARPISIVHDSIWLEVREDAVDEVSAEVKRIMEDPPEEWVGVPLKVDIKPVLPL